MANATRTEKDPLGTLEGWLRRPRVEATEGRSAEPVGDVEGDAKLADFKASQTRTTFTPLPTLGAQVKLSAVIETLGDTSTETYEVYFLEGGHVFSLSATKPTPKATLIQAAELLVPNVRAALTTK